MSYRALLAHRCTVMRLTESFVNGIPTHTWTDVATNVRCFVDLNFVRLGKDPTWTPEAGRPSDRSGVAFFLGSAPIKNGDRIKMTKGPSGTFSLEAAIDEAWRPSAKHHLEISVKEVPKQLAAGYNDQTGR